MQRFESNVLHWKEIKFQAILDILLHLVEGEASRIFQCVLNATWKNIETHQHVNIKDNTFTLWITLHKTGRMSTYEWKTCVKDDDLYKSMVLEEIFFHFCLNYFGDDFVGCNALVKQKSWMGSLRFDYHQHGKLHRFMTCIHDLHAYIMFCPAKWFEMSSRKSAKFTRKNINIVILILTWSNCMSLGGHVVNRTKMIRQSSLCAKSVQNIVNSTKRSTVNITGVKNANKND